MKRILAIFKDLQNSGQQATIVGHFSLQIGNLQDVTNIDNVREQTEIVLSETDASKNPNRYTTEHDRDNVDVRSPFSASVELLPDLLEVIDAWQNLPNPVKTGILAMMKATSFDDE